MYNIPKTVKYYFCNPDITANRKNNNFSANWARFSCLAYLDYLVGLNGQYVSVLKHIKP